MPFELYNTEFGDWPPTAGLNQIPLGMEDFLPANYTTSARAGAVAICGRKLNLH